MVNVGQSVLSLKKLPYRPYRPNRRIPAKPTRETYSKKVVLIEEKSSNAVTYSWFIPGGEESTLYRAVRLSDGRYSLRRASTEFAQASDFERAVRGTYFQASRDAKKWALDNKCTLDDFTSFAG